MTPPLVVVTVPDGAARALAETFELGVHLQLGDFGPDEDLAVDAATAAALAFVRGGYAVVLDGPVRPERIERLAETCLLEAVPLHVGDGSVDLLEAFAAGRLVEIELVGGAEPAAIELHEPDPAWAERFAAERDRLAAALSDRPHRIEHVGSTAVPGLPAKPIVDIQVSVADLADEAPFLAAGYEVRVRERDHRLFRTPARDVHVHVCTPGSDWERRHLLFRDHLRTHPEDRDLYAATKRELATREWETVNHYARAKGDVISAIMRRAGWQD